MQSMFSCHQLAEEENEQRRRQEQMLLEKMEQEEQQEEDTKVRSRPLTLAAPYCAAALISETHLRVANSVRSSLSLHHTEGSGSSKS